MSAKKIKHMFEGFSSLMPVLEENPELLEKTILNLYKNVVGSNADKLRAVGFSDGTLILVARSEAWKKEGIAQSEHIRTAVNAAFGKSVVKQIKWDKWKNFPDTKPAGKTQYKSSKLPEELQNIAHNIGNPEVQKAFISFVRAFGTKGKAGN